MTTAQLIQSSRLAIKELINDNVRAVAVGWDETRACLTLRYYLSKEAGDEEIDLCSCALAELEAEFSPEIQMAIDECIFSLEPIESLDPLLGWVYTSP